MLRVYKKNSEEIGDYTPTQNLMNFDDDIQSADLYDYQDSYLQWNTSITPGTAGNLNGHAVIKLYCFGDNTPDIYPRVGPAPGIPVVGAMKFTPYKPNCLVMNDKLQSTNYNIGIQGLLESNRKLNFMQHNLNTFLEGSETKQSRDYYSGSASLDVSLGASNATFPFTTLIKDGNVPSSYNSSNVIVPLKEVLPSFGNKVLPAWIGDLKHTYTLENRKRVIGEINPLSQCINTYFKVDFLRFNDIPAPGVVDVNQITLTLPFSTLAQLQAYTSSNLQNDVIFGLTYTVAADPQPARQNRSRTCNIAAAGGIVFAGNVCTITFDAGETGFVANEVVTNGKLHLNYMIFRDIPAAPAGNVLRTGVAAGETNLFTNLINFPLYVGMGVHLYYFDPVAVAGGGYISAYRMITNIAIDPAYANGRIVTVDGAVIPVNSTNVFISYDGCYDGQNSDNGAVLGTYPTYKIDRAELVSWHLQGVTNQPNAPIIYNKYDLIPLNRQANTNQFQNTYTLPDGGVVKTIMLMNEISTDNNLIAKDPTLGDYRLAFDNNPTTDKNVITNSPMYYDRIYKSLGGDINNLLVDPQTNIVMENNNTSNVTPLLDVQMNASDGNNLASNSILNLFVKSTAVIAPKKEPTINP